MFKELKTDHLAKRIIALILYTSYFVFTYKTIQVYTQNYVAPIEFALPFEKDIPFIPLSFYIYILAFPFPALLLFVCQMSELKKIVATFIGVSLIHYTVFLVLPIAYSFRPAISANEPDITLNLIHQFHLIDSPLNSFPSIHVSFVMMTYYFLREMKSGWTKFGYIMAYVISISTILVKQHYILDVLGGLLIAYLVAKTTISASSKQMANSVESAI